VRAQLRSGAEHASQTTGNMVDSLVRTVVDTATAAITAKLTQAFGNILPGSNGTRPSRMPSQLGSQPTSHRYLGTDTGLGASSTADTRSETSAA